MASKTARAVLILIVTLIVSFDQVEKVISLLLSIGIRGYYSAFKYYLGLNDANISCNNNVFKAMKWKNY